MKTQSEFPKSYGNLMTKRKLYYQTCIGIHNNIIEIDGTYMQFRDCESSDLIIENLKKARELLVVTFEEALNEARQKWNMEKLVKKLEKSARRHFKWKQIEEIELK